MESNPTLLKVALYARVSSEEQKQGHNIDSQLTELRQFASQRQWAIVEEYVDEAWSGAALARPSLDRLRDDAGKQRFEAVLINDVDRLARDVTHLGVIKRDLERAGIRVIFRKIPSENSPTHNLLVNILGSFAEFERELILDRTRRGRRHKTETRQQFIGAIPPYGYRYTPPKAPERSGTLSIDPEEAAVVRQMFQWVDHDGLSLRRVTQRLAEQKIRPRKGGQVWETSSVGHILHNSAYIGIWYYNKRGVCVPLHKITGLETEFRKTSTRLRAKTEWIAVALPKSLHIIPEDQWHRVQRRIDENKSFSPRNSRHKYLLSGLVECGGCHARYVGNPSHGKFQYRCMNRCKSFPLISEDFLNDTVWTAVEQALENPQLLVGAIEDIQEIESVPPDTAAQLQQASENLAREETRILEAYRLSILNPEQLARELATLKERKRFLEEQQQAASQATRPLEQIRKSVEDYCTEVRERLTNLTFEAKQNVLRTILKKAVFEGEVVRLVGIIPLADSGGIASTTPCLRGRNRAFGNEPRVQDRRVLRPSLDSRPAQVRSSQVTFQIKIRVRRDPSRRTAANRMNLAKASAALQQLRKTYRESSAA